MKMRLPCDTDGAEVAGTADNLYPGAKSDTDKAEALFDSTNPRDKFFPGYYGNSNGFVGKLSVIQTWTWKRVEQRFPLSYPNGECCLLNLFFSSSVFFCIQGCFRIIGNTCFLRF